MTDLDTLQDLLRNLDEGQHKLARLDAYYRGDSPLAFMSPESKKLLARIFHRELVDHGRGAEGVVLV